MIYERGGGDAPSLPPLLAPNCKTDSLPFPRSLPPSFLPSFLVRNAKEGRKTSTHAGIDWAGFLGARFAAERGGAVAIPICSSKRSPRRRLRPASCEQSFLAPPVRPPVKAPCRAHDRLNFLATLIILFVVQKAIRLMTDASSSSSSSDGGGGLVVVNYTCAWTWLSAPAPPSPPPPPRQTANELLDGRTHPNCLFSARRRRRCFDAWLTEQGASGVGLLHQTEKWRFL